MRAAMTPMAMVIMLMMSAAWELPALRPCWLAMNASTGFSSASILATAASSSLRPTYSPRPVPICSRKLLACSSPSLQIAAGRCP
jgi:hypothetical protein